MIKKFKISHHCHFGVDVDQHSGGLKHFLTETSQLIRSQFPTKADNTTPPPPWIKALKDNGNDNHKTPDRFDILFTSILWAAYYSCFIFTANIPGRWQYLCNRYIDSYTGIFKNILGFILGFPCGIWVATLQKLYFFTRK